MITGKVSIEDIYLKRVIIPFLYDPSRPTQRAYVSYLDSGGEIMICVFTTVEKAQDYSKSYGIEFNSIVEQPLYKFLIELAKDIKQNNLLVVLNREDNKECLCWRVRDFDEFWEWYDKNKEGDKQ